MPGARVATGERVTLRTAEEEDAFFLQRAYTNAELRNSLNWDVKSRDGIAADLDDDLGFENLFVVCLDGEDAGPASPDEDHVDRIGAIIVGTDDHYSAIAYWLVPEVHGAGYGTEAVSLALDYNFRVYPHPTMHAKALATNEASRGLLESLGFTQEGELRKRAFRNGEYRDLVSYSLLREEWHDQD